VHKIQVKLSPSKTTLADEKNNKHVYANLIFDYWVPIKF